MARIRQNARKTTGGQSLALRQRLAEHGGGSQTSSSSMGENQDEELLDYEDDDHQVGSGPAAKEGPVAGGTPTASGKSDSRDAAGAQAAAAVQRERGAYPEARVSKRQKRLQQDITEAAEQMAAALTARLQRQVQRRDTKLQRRDTRLQRMAARLGSQEAELQQLKSQKATLQERVQELEKQLAAATAQSKDSGRSSPQQPAAVQAGTNQPAAGQTTVGLPVSLAGRVGATPASSSQPAVRTSDEVAMPIVSAVSAALREMLDGGYVRGQHQPGLVQRLRSDLTAMGVEVERMRGMMQPAPGYGHYSGPPGPRDTYYPRGR